MPARKDPATPPAGFDFHRDDAAAYLGERPATLHAWASQKRNLPYVRCGNRAWYRKSDLDAFLRGKVVTPERAA
jgi:hypothetical protein